MSQVKVSGTWTLVAIHFDERVKRRAQLYSNLIVIIRPIRYIVNLTPTPYFDALSHSLLWAILVTNSRNSASKFSIFFRKLYFSFKFHGSFSRSWTFVCESLRLFEKVDSEILSFLLASLLQRHSELTL